MAVKVVTRPTRVWSKFFSYDSRRSIKQTGVLV
jgi:hypothetical protein